MSIRIIPATKRYFPDWLKLRSKLWPKEDRTGLRRDMSNILASRREAAILAQVDGEIVGFVDLRLRDYAEGATTSPVGYIEGWYVLPQFRKQGVGKLLVKAGEAWAKRKGAREMGSDTWLENTRSHTAHKRLGYTEVERLVVFYKKLR